MIIYHIGASKDRLNDLPECILLHILTFLRIKQAVRTCILSKRWRNLWKHLPTLSFKSSHFTSGEEFNKFVPQILSLHDASTTLHALNFYSTNIKLPLLLSVLEYIASHNVQKLQILGNYGDPYFFTFFVSSHTLTHLRISIVSSDQLHKIIFPDSLDLPALTNLILKHVSFQSVDNPFSRYPKLTSLWIYDFQILGEQNLWISNTTLLNLALQLPSKPDNYHEIMLSTPSLSSICFIGIPFRILPGSNLSSVKQVYIDADIGLLGDFVKPPYYLLSWLLEFANINSLKVSTNTLQVLSLVHGLSKVVFHSLCNLKSLKIERKGISHGLSKALIDTNLVRLPAKSEEEAAKLQKVFKVGSSSIPDGIVEFLLQNTTSSKVRIIN